MNPLIVSQRALDDVVVAPDDRAEIGKTFAAIIKSSNPVRKNTINGSVKAGYDKSKGWSVSYYQVGSLCKECRGLGIKDNSTMKKSSSKLALMAFQTLMFNKSEFNLATYKRRLASIEEQLVFYKKNEVLFCEQLVVLKRDISYKDSEISVLKRSQIPDKSRKGLGFVSYNVVPPPPTGGLFSPPNLDLSNSSLEEFQQPEFEGYRPKSSKSVSKDTSNEVRESLDAPLVEKLVSDDKPDIMIVVCACARFQVTPNVSHLHAVKRIFRYLKGQPKLGLWYPKDSPFDFEAYTDSNYAGASLDRKSTTGGCQFLERRFISWQCKKQTIVANSTTKAEYVVASSCCGHVLWIQNQMLDYGYNFINTKIHIDNKSTICIVKNPVFYSKTKHIEIRHHFIRDSNEKKLIQMIKIHTDHNVTDLLTKAFDVGRFQYLIASIGMLNP
ncbi:hypothetical protein Tco_1368786 [Tanacetum coccineum]